MILSVLNKIVSYNNIPEDAELRSDSGWECSDTEIDMVYYNSKTNVLMLTRKYGNYDTYEKSEDWKLLYKEEKTE